MKRNFGKIGAAVMVLVLCMGTAIAYAQGPERGPGWGGPHARMHNMARQLNLTDQQKQQVKTIMQQQRSTTRPLMQQMAENRKAMLAATSNGAFDQAKVQSIANQQAQLMAQLIVARETVQHQIYTQVLTADQRAKADQMKANQINRIDQRLQNSQGTNTPAPEQ